MPMAVSLDPISSRDFGLDQARHLLLRAGFGGTRRQAMQLVEMGLDAAVSHLVAYDTVDDTALPAARSDPDIIKPYSAEVKLEFVRARRENDLATLDRLRRLRLEGIADDRRQMGQIERWWVGRIIATPRPLQEKLTLLWHGHFAANHRTVEDSHLMLQQNEMFRRNAAGCFADLLMGIVHDPAMLKFLNNTENRKSKPNENLAREIMELFALGEGQYSEADIQQGARALTGYFVEDNDFSFNQRQHDPGAKRILGKVGAFNGDDFVRILLAHPSCPLFVAFKLYRHFVLDLSESVPAESKTVIERLADLLRREAYQLRPVLVTLLKSRHFYDPAVLGNKIKSPVELVAGAIRSMALPVRDVGLLCDALSMMGQKLFDPPSVAGWEPGRAWMNTSTLLTRQNTCAYLVTGKLPYEDGWSKDRVGFSPASLIEDLKDRQPAAVVDHLASSLLARPLATQRRDELVAFLAQRSDATSDDALLALLLLITALPEYQLC